MDITIEPVSLPDSSMIVDVHSTRDYIFVLRTTHEVEIFNPQLSLLRSLSLEKTSVPCRRIYADDTTLLIAFDDATMEIRLINEDFDLLRVSNQEAMGPGSRQIVDIAASDDFVILLTYENGLMIFTKPSLLFYKWIMLGGHTEITRFSIYDHLLYVLVQRPEHEIHMLDFDKHRIFEQYVRAKTFVDIEFDGKYLYAATESEVQVYQQEVADRPQKQYFITSIDFDTQINQLIRYQDNVYVVFATYMQQLELQADQIIMTDKISIHPELAVRLKYGYFTDHYVSPIPIMYRSQQQLYLATINS